MYYTSSYTPIYGKTTRNRHRKADTETLRQRDRENTQSGSKDLTDVPVTLFPLTTLACRPSRNATPFKFQTNRIEIYRNKTVIKT